ncbi:MAG TPA: hypothetical protein VNS79_13130 [Sphingobium sp.]|nr:hypothetical protein [Sphingobium sp.]
MSDKPKVQGEGNYEAARAYDAETSKHAKDKAAVHKEAEAAKRALSGSEAEALAAAEREGRSHARR